jgi:hypothetical protein
LRQALVQKKFNVRLKHLQKEQRVPGTSKHSYQLLSVRSLTTRGNRVVYPALYFSVGTNCAAFTCNIRELVAFNE